MAIQSISQTNVVTIPRRSTLKEVSQLMHRRHVGCVVVTELHDNKLFPAGIITDRDVALTLGFSEKPQELVVDNIMHSQPITVKRGEGIFETVLKMNEFGVKRLPVVNEDGSLFGIVCADDLLNLFGEEILALGKVTESQIQKEKGFKLPVEKQKQLNFHH